MEEWPVLVRRNAATPESADLLMRRTDEDRMLRSYEEAIGTLRNTILLGALTARSSL